MDIDRKYTDIGRLNRHQFRSLQVRPQKTMYAEVLIGSPTPKGSYETKGTGFLVSSGSRLFVVTCRHVVAALPAGTAIAIPNCQERVFPQSSRESIQLQTVVFHPADNAEGSHDIALYEIPSDAGATAYQGTQPMRVETLSREHPIQIGTAIVISGYSVDHLTKHFDPSSPRSLPPERTHAHVRAAPLHSLRINGFDRTLMDVQFAQTAGGIPIGEGTSGAPIFRGSDEACVGLLIASVDAAWTLATGLVVTAKGGAFVPARYVREAIESA